MGRLRGGLGRGERTRGIRRVLAKTPSTGPYTMNDEPALAAWSDAVLHLLEKSGSDHDTTPHAAAVRVRTTTEPDAAAHTAR